jgi:ribose transport system permease protein
VRIQVLVLSGILAAVGAVMALGYFSSGDPQLGTGYELQAIAAAVIGGTPLSGGNATVAGAAVGAILLGVVNSGLVYFNVPLNWTSFATGSVIIVAVALDGLLRRRRNLRRLSLGT